MDASVQKHVSLQYRCVLGLFWGRSYCTIVYRIVQAIVEFVARTPTRAQPHSHTATSTACALTQELQELGAHALQLGFHLRKVLDAPDKDGTGVVVR